MPKNRRKKNNWKSYQSGILLPTFQYVNSPTFCVCAPHRWGRILYYSVACFLHLTICVNIPSKSINVNAPHIYRKFLGIGGDACLRGFTSVSTCTIKQTLPLGKARAWAHLNPSALPQPHSTESCLGWARKSPWLVLGKQHTLPALCALRASRKQPRELSASAANPEGFPAPRLPSVLKAGSSELKERPSPPHPYLPPRGAPQGRGSRLTQRLKP